MENTEISLFSRTLASIIVFVGDNFWILSALIWYAFDDMKVAGAMFAFAIFMRLTEIRDGMSAPEVTVTLNTKPIPHDEPTI